MKIKDEHFKQMLETMRPLSKHIKEQREFIIREGKAKDIEKRLRWDLLWMSKLSPFLCNVLYKYADDSHVDTALKKIMKELQK